MKYAELIRIFRETTPLKWIERNKSFSEGIAILSKYCYSDFPNLHIDKVTSQVVDEEYYIILYGSISEILEEISSEEVRTLARLGWIVTEGLDENDNYFKYRL